MSCKNNPGATHFACDCILKELYEAKAEVELARSRLGPAGYKILEEYKELKAEVERLKEEREEWVNEFSAVVMAKTERDALKVENERLRDILRCCERQQYGFKNAWACADWRKCDLHGMYGTMGNWQDDDRCPWCRAIVVLEQENGE